MDEEEGGKSKRLQKRTRIAEGWARFEKVFIEVEDLEVCAMLMILVLICCLEDAEEQEKWCKAIEIFRRSEAIPGFMKVF